MNSYSEASGRSTAASPTRSAKRTAGTSDTLAVYGDADFTVDDRQIIPSTGGSIRHVNTERISVRGGNGANVIDATANTGRTMTTHVNFSLERGVGMAGHP